MHMVCQEHETAYWDGSKGVCCDGNVYQKDENEYACCPTNQFVKNVSGSPYQTCCANDYLSGYILDDAVMCCSNDPNADDQNKQCCTNGGEWTLIGNGYEEISFQYACGGQRYCDMNYPGTHWGQAMNLTATDAGKRSGLRQAEYDLYACIENCSCLMQDWHEYGCLWEGTLTGCAHHSLLSGYENVAEGCF